MSMVQSVLLKDFYGFVMRNNKTSTSTPADISLQNKKGFESDVHILTFANHCPVSATIHF
jgi:hypothetical protein